MASEQITVKVADYGPGRKYLMMRYTDPTTGRRVARSAGTTNRREADRVAAKWEADLREGRYAPACKTTWEDFVDRYTREVGPGLAVKTQAMIGTVFNAVERISKPTRLADLTAARLSGFAAELRQAGRSEQTIKSYLAHLSAALSWAVDLGMLRAMPKIPKVQRAKGSKVMKGRPVTAEEFERMLAKVPDVVGEDAAPSWRHYLEGLWWSGLRLAESLQLYWDRPDRLCVDLSGRRPMLRIPAELEKGNQDRLLPIAPEFAEFLFRTPEEERRGRVFRLMSSRGEWRGEAVAVGKVVSRIGRVARVVVNRHPTTGKVKHASAHDLRRSFGERWASRVMPQVLKELMRHESIETTLRFYVGRNAQTTADAVWAAFEGVGAGNGNTCGNTGRNQPSLASSENDTSPSHERACVSTPFRT